MRKFIGLFIALLVLTVISGAILHKQPMQSKVEQKLKSFSYPSLGINLQYPEQLQEESLNERDQQDRIIWRATDQADGREVLATLRWEDDLQKVSATTRQPGIEVISANIRKAFPLRYPDYELKEERRLVHKGYEALEVVFDYTGPSGTAIRQRFMAVMLDADRVIYLAAQTRQSAFEEVNKSYLQTMFTSLFLRSTAPSDTQ